MPTQEAPPLVAAERAGSRWLHAAPSEQDVREWFETQRLHPGMTHDPYVSGLVLIGAKEKVNVTRRKHDGQTYVQEVEQAVFVPYVKVDTRIAYFRDYVRLLNAKQVNADNEPGDMPIPQEFGDFYGVIRPVVQVRIADEGSPYFNDNLPDGFTAYPVRVSDSKVSRYLVATFEAAIFRRRDGQPDQLVARGQGSKQVATIQRNNYPDDNAMMKAETGAIGRALGVLGMLVVGTGVATAEDVQEATSAPSSLPPAATSALPPSAQTSDVTTDAMIAEVAALAPPPGERIDAIDPDQMGPIGPALEPLPDADADLRGMALTFRKEMESKFPNAWRDYTGWWAERGFPQLDELEGPALRGAVIKLQRELDACKQAKSDSECAQ